MSSTSVLLENVGSVGATELACSVQEEDWQSGETYNARWRNVSFSPRPQDRQWVSETDPRRGQTRRWEARCLLLRCLPGGALRKGQSAGPQPPVRAPLLGTRAPQGRPEEVVRCRTVPRRSVVGSGAGARTDAAPVPSTKGGFAKMQTSLGRVWSQEAQRG